MDETECGVYYLEPNPSRYKAYYLKQGNINYMDLSILKQNKHFTFYLLDSDKYLKLLQMEICYSINFPTSFC